MPIKWGTHRAKKCPYMPSFISRHTVNFLIFLKKITRPGLTVRKGSTPRKIYCLKFTAVFSTFLNEFLHLNLSTSSLPSLTALKGGEEASNFFGLSSWMHPIISSNAEPWVSGKVLLELTFYNVGRSGRLCDPSWFPSSCPRKDDDGRRN